MGVIYLCTKLKMVRWWSTPLRSFRSNSLWKSMFLSLYIHCIIHQYMLSLWCILYHNILIITDKFLFSMLLVLFALFSNLNCLNYAGYRASQLGQLGHQGQQGQQSQRVQQKLNSLSSEFDQVYIQRESINMRLRWRRFELSQFLFILGRNNFVIFF